MAKDGKKEDYKNDPSLIAHKCFICGKIVAFIKIGSAMAQGAGLVCAACQEKWELLKKAAEMFRKEAKKAQEKKNPFDVFNNIFGGK